MNLVYVRLGNAPGAGEVPITFNDTIWIKLNEVMCSTADVPSIDNRPLISIYPNPATDHLKIKFPNPGNHQLKISDLTGREVNTYQNLQTQTEIFTGFMNRGIYFLHFTHESGNVTIQKIILK